jgi:hypothetical protein
MWYWVRIVKVVKVVKVVKMGQVSVFTTLTTLTSLPPLTFPWLFNLYQPVIKLFTYLLIAGKTFAGKVRVSHLKRYFC